MIRGSSFGAWIMFLPNHNTKRAFLKMPANRTCRRHGLNDANDPRQPRRRVKLWYNLLLCTVAGNTVINDH
jgi:hypothetical protein